MSTGAIVGTCAGVSMFWALCSVRYAIERDALAFYINAVPAAIAFSIMVRAIVGAL